MGKKVAFRHQLLLKILSKIRKGIFFNGELNCFGVGQSISPIAEICLYDLLWFDKGIQM